MKKIISFLLISGFFIQYQILLAQSSTEQIKEVHNLFTQKDNAGASKLFGEIIEPKGNSEDAVDFVVYNFLKSSLEQQKWLLRFKGHPVEADAKKALEAVVASEEAFKILYKKGFFKGNTQNKILKEYPFIDQDGNCFKILREYWEKEIKKFDTQNQNTLEKMQGDLENMRLAIADNLERLTTEEVNQELKNKKSKATNDSVSFGVKVYRDSASMRLFFVSENPKRPDLNLTHPNGVGQISNDKINAFIQIGTKNMIRSYRNHDKTNILKVSVIISGEADDTWRNIKEKQCFKKDYLGLGEKIGIKPGDKISNDTIALLRVLNAEIFMTKGIEELKELEGIEVEIETKVLNTQDWMKDPRTRVGSIFRKIDITFRFYP